MAVDVAIVDETSHGQRLLVCVVAYRTKRTRKRERWRAFFFLLNIAGFEKKYERSQLFFKDRPISNLVARETIPYRRVPWYWPKFL